MAAELDVMQFDEKRLRSCLGSLREQTRKKPDDVIPSVQSICASAGIAMVWVPQLSHTGISGCARWLTEKKALIALTLRYGTDDQVWFTFFHEVAHILLHRKRHEFILDNAVEDLGDRVVDPEMQSEEEEANRFAADTLIPPDALSVFVKQNEFTNESIKQFADNLSIGPGILVGRLQREGLLKHFQGNKLKQRFDWRIAH